MPALHLYYMRWRCSKRKNAWFTGNEFGEEEKNLLATLNIAKIAFIQFVLVYFGTKRLLHFFRWSSQRFEKTRGTFTLKFSKRQRHSQHFTFGISGKWCFFFSLSLFSFKCAIVVCKYFQNKNWRIVIAVLHLTKKKERIKLDQL